VSPVVPDTVVVIDTDAFSQVFVSTRGPNSRDLRDRLVGRIPVVAAQTYAELRAWPRIRKWGDTRSGQLDRILAGTTVVPVTPEVIEAFVDLTVGCRECGHALGDKIHTADRWVAATAIAIDRPLVALDGVYLGTPGLALV
jgi:predicted nucleic acid-binding protein